MGKLESFDEQKSFDILFHGRNVKTQHFTWRDHR